MRLVLATWNLDKIREIRQILKDIEIIPISKFPGAEKVEEMGLTFWENAYLKAKYAFELTGLPSAADDTGLVVDYLHGFPGVFSSRFAGENATYTENRKKLLRLLKGVPMSKRRASFVCVVAFVDKNNIAFFEGRVDGFIIPEERGSGTFGYDPVFLYPPYGRTFAEIPVELKNRVSHRFKAFKQLKEFLHARSVSG